MRVIWCMKFRHVCFRHFSSSALSYLCDQNVMTPTNTESSQQTSSFLVNSAEDLSTHAGAVVEPVISDNRDDIALHAIFPQSTQATETVATSSPSARQAKQSVSTLKDWRWEVISWALGTAFLLALLLLLALFDNKSTSEWKSKLSINAIASALAQAAQSSLAVSLGSCISQLKWDWFRQGRPTHQLEIFDEASRGPLGSLFLLWEQIFKAKAM